MGKDISLILTDSQSLVDVVKASRQPDAPKFVFKLLKQTDERDEGFSQYIAETLSQNDMTQDADFNNEVGFVASWLLASVKPTWYLRNCSVSLFLEDQAMPDQRKYRYVSDWASAIKNNLDNVTIQNHFTDANYSLGCFISPDNCRNFFNDYENEPIFRQAVRTHFGIFTAGLLDAMLSAIETNTGLIESMDVLTPISADRASGQWQFLNQLCYTTATYSEMNIALQIFSIEVQTDNARVMLYQKQGQEEKVIQSIDHRNSLIDLMIKNGNVYVDRVSTETGLKIPRLTTSDWN
jgi:hypothetical protein